MTQAIQASIYRLPEPDTRASVKELWQAMANDLAAAFPKTYTHDREIGYKIRVLAEAVAAPDQNIVRYRTIEVALRRKRGCPTLLDVSTGNFFCQRSTNGCAPNEVLTSPIYATWVRKAGAIPLQDHLRLVRNFTSDLCEAGWIIEQEEWTSIALPCPEIVTGRGACAFPVGKILQAAKNPVMLPSGNRTYAVVSSSKIVAELASRQLSGAFGRLLPGGEAKLLRIIPSATISAAATNLVLIDENEDLSQNPRRRDQLRMAESEGVRFKLCKIGTMAKPYPSLNIAFDLFVISGGVLWTPGHPQPPFCSFDAGHDPKSGRSRWVKVETDERQSITCVQVENTSLAEHMPQALVDQFWPDKKDAIICRDGRLAQERKVIEAKAAQERRPLIEMKKSPRSVLWRSLADSDAPALFGDAVIDSHGDVLIQTVPQEVSDYITPVRLSIQGEVITEIAAQFLAQHLVPGLSLFKMSRLPGSPYFADLISKLTADGWPKAIGRGFGIAMIIP